MYKIHHVQALDDSDENESGEEFSLFTLGTRMAPSLMITVDVEGVPLEMELDTGAAVSLVSMRTWEEKWNKPLQKSSIVLTTYSGEKLKVLGQTETSVFYNGKEAVLPLVVVKGEGLSLFGRNWLEPIRLDWQNLKIDRVAAVTRALENLLVKHKELFKLEVGTMEGHTAHLEVNAQATPRFYKPRSVPYALRGAIEKELDRMETNGMLERVETSRCAAPIVPVPKADGTVHLCGDYKVTINPVLSVTQYPLPKPEDLFATLAKGEKFSKLDLANAYQQVLLDEQSRELVTINTHKGLYRFTSLPFGVASAPAVFQNLMDKILHGIKSTGCYLDGILVTGRNDKSI